MLTDEQLEEASKLLCKKLDLDPDELVGTVSEPDESGMVPMNLLEIPRWQLLIPEVKVFVHTLTAITEAGTKH